MPAPWVSFLTPVYRTESYLPATIESVLAQSDPDWELILVDNGMSDEVVRIAARYPDTRIRLLRQQNCGYAGGVMAASSAACGQFVAVLDSDDLLAPEYVDSVAAFIRAHPSVDAVGCDAYQFADGNREPFISGYFRSTAIRRGPRRGRRLTVDDVLAGEVPYYSSAIRRTAWNQVRGYRPGFSDVDESVVVWLRLTEKFDVRLIPDKLAWYRVRDTSLSRDPAGVEDFERRLLRSFALFGNDPARMSARTRRAVDRNLRRLRFQQAMRRARRSLLDDDVNAARGYARAALAQRPCLRAAVVLASLTVAPHAAKAVHPVKQRMIGAGARAARITRTRLRSAGPPPPATALR
ncbi:glycosyltransferase family 2 protein [Tomitella fengzijianii]|uniref:Glycosyltransferase family 2 protein n=1 Tax=Tomitella fengzijianii TaxID=2597660 RepID=A0A516X0W2_9ACTN|nr:glycosyltransferase family 2 protein [Tomitella fengzijianii]QDQ96670.1 glycosyltransferase family 2 protein [Tomitella fengzijianii]